MGFPSQMRDVWENKRRESFLIASPYEEAKRRRSDECTQEGVRAGVKAAAIACVASAIPTIYTVLHTMRDKDRIMEKRLFILTAVRTIPWAKANLNYTAQALIISAASIAAYFITADKTILECARRNTHYDK